MTMPIAPMVVLARVILEAVDMGFGRRLGVDVLLSP